MTHKDKYSKWKKTRAKGTLHFIFSSGIFVGIVFFLLFGLLQFIDPPSSPERKLKHFFETENIIAFFASSLIFGFIWALVFWIWMEWDFQKHIGSKNFRFWKPNETNKFQ